VLPGTKPLFDYEGQLEEENFSSEFIELYFSKRFKKSLHQFILDLFDAEFHFRKKNWSLHNDS